MAKSKADMSAAGKAPHMVRVLHGDTPVWANSTKKGEYRCTKCGQTGHQVVRS